MEKSIKDDNQASEEPTRNITIKNFKTASEVQDFYRFVHENGLRVEAKKLVEIVLKKITPPKRRGRKKIIH